jgi:hypothetical protein
MRTTVLCFKRNRQLTIPRLFNIILLHNTSQNCKNFKASILHCVITNLAVIPLIDIEVDAVRIQAARSLKFFHSKLHRL